MSLKLKRKSSHLLSLSLLLLVVVFIFSFFVLIPQGKEYRTLRLENKKEDRLLTRLQERNNYLHEQQLKLSKTHQVTIKALKQPFNAQQFTQAHRDNFKDLFLSELQITDQNGSFKIYEVNATTKINSPQAFYDFLEDLNHGDWIIGVNFPIHFERDGDLIKSSFTMKVHNFADITQEELD